ncbi:hypothetical protein AcW1_003745 [Taiwanofungus camphoratus]|nr:hypothetical protein AcV5_003578 [Antrodia cinnamomea]KAI0940589.1 hypothetical protein AcW1_003745 [Antrodia cinnamomea]KAI0958238.1 hypothetical protein AcV7_004111 [Antrodia cinnamomea]
MRCEYPNRLHSSVKETELIPGLHLVQSLVQPSTFIDSFQLKSRDILVKGKDKVIMHMPRTKYLIVRQFGVLHVNASRSFLWPAQFAADHSERPCHGPSH